MFDRPRIRSLLLGSLLVVLVFADANPCNAAIVAYLTESRALAGERFESDLMFVGSSDMFGDEIELINLDIVNSQIQSSPLLDFTRVRFEVAAGFVGWQDTQQFGATPGFESQIVLDAFATVAAIPYPLVDTNPFAVGTLTFDYSGLGLQAGDVVTLDIRGKSDGSATRTTSIAIRPQGSALTTLVNPDFSSPAGSERSTFAIVSAIPEPSLFTALAMAGIVVGCRRRRRA